MKKIVVTGASGFIGSHVVDNLLSKGYEVICFDHRSEAMEIDRRERVTHFMGDVKNYTDISEAVAISDGIIHLAGVLGTQETIENPEPAVQTNILGGLNVFQAVKHYRVPAVYIAVGNFFENNSYSISKTTAERFALMFNKEHGTKIAVVRGLNAYGPYQKAYPVRKIMPNFVIPALLGKPITIYGDGNQVMDMIYVTDLAEILVRALIEDHGVYDSVFEAGSGNATTVNDIADEVLRQVTEEDGVALPDTEHVPMRPGETPGVTVLGNPGTLRPLFGGELPEMVTLEEGVRKTVEWYRKTV